MGAQAAGALIAEKKREEFVQRLRQGGSSMLDKLGHTRSAPMRGATGPATAAAILTACRRLLVRTLMLPCSEGTC